jgi:signal transduction histidine kinase
VWADRDRIDQVMRNLLENAVKYSPDSGDIEVRMRQEDQCVRISVADHGIGIPSDQRELVFERFFRVHTPLTQSVPGAGLGLPTCRAIVNAHGGRIWVESSDGDGNVRGTTVTFTLPTPLGWAE